MNKLTTTIVAAASLAVVWGASSATAHAGAILDNVLATKTLKVAVGTDWGVLSFVNDKGELDGFDVAVAKSIAEHMGVQAQFVTPGWELIVAGNWEHRWDIGMGQMVPTKARAEKFAFPATYFYSRTVAVVHKDSKATKLSDLNGKTVGASAATVDEDYLRHTLSPDWAGAQPIEFQFTPGQIKAYPSSDVAPENLRLGDGVRLDAIIQTQETLLTEIKSGYPFKQLGDPLYFTPCAIASSLEDKEFNDKIATAIKDMKDDGTLTKLSMKWYGADYTVEQ
ncbi:MAG: transporter substrate-binding domain-containing protein [Mesorhizobium sp.]|uniref:transporter substrate-binding domain-containing protein n=1 Tax=Mesorhizobium sp. TaxID=1871066 RepID=UPI000FE8246D|nr:transporter substrate-binding domain-containing protein [Mesorhizobium sp.]RWP25785.1 MAG: transporter substrate-binding domain-containing protein [Mesorhizobium sp.]